MDFFKICMIGAAMKKFAPVRILIALPLLSQTPPPAEPVNPNATPEARKLLSFPHEISGRCTLAAQHNYANSGYKNTDLTRAITGRTPLIRGSDFSFCYEGNEPQNSDERGRVHRQRRELSDKD
jgi:hypothetical protein